MATKGILAQTAAKGRRTDTLLGHLTPGDLVVPRERVTPGILASLGADAPRYVAGTEDNSINPKTGLPEFFDADGAGADGMGTGGRGGEGWGDGRDAGGYGGNLGAGGMGLDGGYDNGTGPGAMGAPDPSQGLGNPDPSLGSFAREMDPFSYDAGRFDLGPVDPTFSGLQAPEVVNGWLTYDAPTWGKIGSRAAVGALTGGLMGGPVGALAGAGRSALGALASGIGIGGYNVGGMGIGVDPSGPRSGSAGPTGARGGSGDASFASPQDLANGALGSAGVVGGQGNQGAGPLAQQAQPFPNWSNPYLAPAANDPARWQAMWSQRNRGILGG